MNTLDFTPVTPRSSDKPAEEILADHPEIAANRPAWASHVTAAPDFDLVSVGYDAHFGSVQLGTSAYIDASGFKIADNGEVFLYFEDRAVIDGSSLRQYAADFLAAAEAFERAEPAT